MRLTHKTAGFSPKKFASLVRLRRAVRPRATGAEFGTVALAAGYCDQTHFINDFRRATGRAPDAFFPQTPAA